MVFFTQSGEADIRAHITILYKFNARFLQLRDAFHYNGFFKFEARDPIGQKAARTVIAVIDCDLYPRAG